MNLLGKKYEEIAVSYLKKQGYIILERNYTTKTGEIDIIAKDGNCIVFVEVKARKNSTYDPSESVIGSKRNKIIKTSLIYLKSKNLGQNIDFRYDVLSIRGDINSPSFTLFKNAFSSDRYFI
jgi:putative endonuclease